MQLSSLTLWVQSYPYRSTRPKRTAHLLIDVHVTDPVRHGNTQSGGVTTATVTHMPKGITTWQVRATEPTERKR